MTNKKIKIIEVLGILNQGGIETWLKDVVHYYDKEKYQIDFMVQFTDTGTYDASIRGEDSKIHVINRKEGIIRFSRNVYRLFKQKKYDVVHSHVFWFSGYICFIAFLAGISLRISHSHNSAAEKDRSLSLSRKIYVLLMKFLISCFSNKKMACSELAGKSLFGKKKFDMINYGVDFTNFIKKENTDRDKILKNKGLNIPNDSIIIGHVGRFAEQKNHQFLIDIYQQLINTLPNVYLLLIGDGPLLEEIKTKANKCSEKILFLGARSDVNVFMRDVFDGFMFPSLWEGLGIVLLEAQAAGLKCLISDVIPKEGIIVEENVFCLSLADSPQKWADTVYNLLTKPDTIAYTEVVNKITASSFSIQYSVRKLEEIYSEIGIFRRKSIQ
jgi:glycosyltransferase involved in cell wall biosynthesis